MLSLNTRAGRMAGQWVSCDTTPSSTPVTEDESAQYNLLLAPASLGSKGGKLCMAVGLCRAK